jgi:hypothetical protein
MEEVLDKVSNNGGNLKVTESIKTSLKSLRASGRKLYR